MEEGRQGERMGMRQKQDPSGPRLHFRLVHPRFEIDAICFNPIAPAAQPSGAPKTGPFLPLAV